MKMIGSVLVAMTTVLGACAPAVMEMRSGTPHAARPPSCELQFVTVTPDDMKPGARFGAGGELEMVGTVTLAQDEQGDPMSEAVRKIVRPRACAMGGEAVSLLAASQRTDAFGAQQGQRESFIVWATAAPKSSTPTTF